MSVIVDSPSENVQMYLVTIARLQKDGRPVPLSLLSRELGISPVSTNQMCHKLQDQGLLIYRPYKGASLTPEGKQLAHRILRHHRLWEVFLVEKLGFDYIRAHEIACRLEHATSGLLADRLDAFLGHPKSNPRGEPIPTANGSIVARPLCPLTALSAGQQGHVVRCEVKDEAAQAFLDGHGIRTGATITVMATADDSLLIRVGDSTVSLARALAAKVQIDAESAVSVPTQSVEEVQAMEKETRAKQVTLDRLSAGQRGIVVHVGGQGAARRRMMDMGLVPGSEVKMVRVAPLGDPVEFEVKGYSLSLRKSEARAITVEIMEEKVK